MKHTIAVAVLAIVILSGCGARGFVKPGATYQDFYRDLQVCNGTAVPVNLAGTDAPEIHIAAVQVGLVNQIDTGAQAFATLKAFQILRNSGHNRNSRNNCLKYLNWKISRKGEVFHP